MPSADVTLRTLTLGTADTITGWYAKTFSTSTIEMAILNKADAQRNYSMGLFPEYALTGYTKSILREGDEILRGVEYFTVETLKEWFVLDTFYYNQVELAKRDLHADRPATSGTWYMDATPLNVEPRYRFKKWLDDYLSAAALKKDDGATAAAYLVAFDGADYPITRIFDDKGIDVYFTVSEPQSEPIFNADKSTDSYRESVPVEIWTMDKTGITGANLKWKAEHALRVVAETYIFGTVRTIKQTTPKTSRHGAETLHSYRYMIEYVREKS